MSKLNLELIADGWLELESDPGLFTLLVRDFGVEGVDVEEIYDLDGSLEEDILGFIFLFKYTSTSSSAARRNRRLLQLSSLCNGDATTHEATNGLWTPCEVRDADCLNRMFFAHQVVPNSCATHALLSVLLNRSSDVCLGSVLSRYLDLTVGLSPVDKGHAIANVPELAAAHNRHAGSSSVREAVNECQRAGSSFSKSGPPTSNRSGSYSLDTFHYSSFVPINGRLYELDGLKEYPVDHGIIPSGLPWTERFRTAIAQRIERTKKCGSASEEIRYNLMAVRPSRVLQCEKQQQTLKDNLVRLLDVLQEVVLENRKADVASWSSELKKQYNVSKMLLDVDSNMPSTSGGVRSWMTEVVAPVVCNGTATEVAGITVAMCNGDSLGVKPSCSSAAIDILPEINIKTEPVDAVLPRSFSVDQETLSPNRGPEPSFFVYTETKKLLNEVIEYVSNLVPSPLEDLPSQSKTSTPLEIIVKQEPPEKDVKPVMPSNLEDMGSSPQLHSTSSPPVASTSDAIVRTLKRSLLCNYETLCVRPRERARASLRSDREQPVYLRLCTENNMRHVTTASQLCAELLTTVEHEIESLGSAAHIDARRLRQFEIDDARRTHDYDAFCRTFLWSLIEFGIVDGLVDSNGAQQQQGATKLTSLQKRPPACKEVPVNELKRIGATLIRENNVKKKRF